MIAIAGYPDEAPVRLVTEALDAIGAAHITLDPHKASAIDLDVRIGGSGDGGAITGRLMTDDATIEIEHIKGVYFRSLGTDPAPALARFGALMDVLPARVLNRPAAMASNASKPYQSLAARACGFAIPETRVTNDPLTARAFIEAAWAAGHDVVYKSMSGVRSIVQTFSEHDWSRLIHLGTCPVQFQHRIAGDDIRVHVIGRTVHAARIQSSATDYRYAERQGSEAARLAPIDLPIEDARRCVALAESLDLPLAGIDLRRDRTGVLYCFEANPSPAFSYYETATGLPIAAAIASYLVGSSA